MAERPPKLHVKLNENERFRKLKESFIEHFGEPPHFYACAPGRVNLIGEHIDYCGYAVLPMAIEQNILTAVSVNDTQRIELANVNQHYRDFAVSSEELRIDRTNPQWYYYFLCGVRGVKEHLGLTLLAGMKCVVDGTVPPSSGLSSSSALVCCAGLVTLEANNKMLSKMCFRWTGDSKLLFLCESACDYGGLASCSGCILTRTRGPQGSTLHCTNGL